MPEANAPGPGGADARAEKGLIPERVVGTSIMKLSSAQFRVLRCFVDHVSETNCGPILWKGHSTNAPMGNQKPVFASLLRLGFIEPAGQHGHEAGNFHYKVQAYRLTPSGMMALRAALPGSVPAVISPELLARAGLT